MRTVCSVASGSAASFTSRTAGDPVFVIQIWRMLFQTTFERHCSAGEHRGFAEKTKHLHRLDSEMQRNIALSRYESPLQKLKVCTLCTDAHLLHRAKAEGEIMERDVRSAETIPWHRAV
jgi:hypothetical protein